MADRLVFEGIATEHDGEIEWWSLDEADDAGNLTSDVSWLEGLDGKRVRLTVEVIEEEKGDG